MKMKMKEQIDFCSKIFILYFKFFNLTLLISLQILQILQSIVEIFLHIKFPLYFLYLFLIIRDQLLTTRAICHPFQFKLKQTHTKQSIWYFDQLEFSLLEEFDEIY